jgi:hypothetical protein
MRRFSFGSAVLGVMFLQSLNAGADSAQITALETGSRFPVSRHSGVLLSDANPAGVVSGLVFRPGAAKLRQGEYHFAWAKVRRFGGSPPAANTAPETGNPAEGEAAPQSVSPPAEGAAQPMTTAPEQGESANPPEQGVASPKAAEGTPAPKAAEGTAAPKAAEGTSGSEASGQPAESKPEVYIPPKVETSPAGVTIYRGP